MKRYAFAVLAAGLGSGCGLDSTGDSSSPLIEITAPRLSVVAGNVDFSANVLDDTGVAEVRFLVDGTLLFTDTEGPYLTSWDTTVGVVEGLHTMQVQATDLSGNTASVSKQVTVNNGAPNLRGRIAQR